MIVVRTRTVETRTIAFRSMYEAFDALSDYNTLPAAAFQNKYGTRDSDESTALAYAAARRVLKTLAVSVNPTVLAALAPYEPAPDASLFNPPANEEETALAKKGKLIQAIKAYRDRTGIELKAAKAAVEAAIR